MTEERVGALEHQMRVLTWLHAELGYRHAELAHKHAELVAELRTLIAQMLGPNAGGDPRAQAVRQRALRLARIRNAAAQRVVNP